MSILNASDARRISAEKKSEFINTELAALNEKIIIATNRGYTAIVVFTLDLSIKSELEKLGYKVTYYDDQREGKSSYTISWV